MYQSDAEVDHMWTMVTEIVTNYPNRIPLGVANDEKVYGTRHIRLTLDQKTGRCKVMIKNTGDDCFTTVFDCRRGRANVYRAGKWCAHVDALYEKVERQRRDAMYSPGLKAPISAEQLSFSSTDEEPRSYPVFNDINDWEVAYC